MDTDELHPQGASSSRVLVRQLRQRRDLLRSRAKLLLQQMPHPHDRTADQTDSQVSHSPFHAVAGNNLNRAVRSTTNPYVHPEDINVFASELQRTAWNPIMEVAHLVFCICSATWQREHQQRCSALCTFFSTRGDAARREKAWDKLLDGTFSNDIIDSPPTAAVRGAGKPLSATDKWSTHLSIVQGKLALHAERQPHTMVRNRSNTTTPDDLSEEEEDSDGYDSDTQMEMLVALKYAEGCAARRPITRCPPSTLPSSVSPPSPLSALLQL